MKARRLPADVFKPYIVKRGDGGCQVLFPLSELDRLVAATIAAASAQSVRLDDLQRRVAHAARVAACMACHEADPDHVCPLNCPRDVVISPSALWAGWSARDLRADGERAKGTAARALAAERSACGVYQPVGGEDVMGGG